MAGSRDKILSRIREALQDERALESDRQSRGERAPGDFREVMPPAAQSLSEQISQFAAFAEMLRAEFHTFDDAASAGKFLAALATAEHWTQVALDESELAQALREPLGDFISIRQAGDGIEKHELERCDAAITGCECLVAQTGSVCVTAHNGGRALSVLPPHHIVMARRGQMVSDLSAAYEWLAKKYADNWPSFLGFITGPSRTGDIERILVLGAHGPKRLTILLVP